MKNTFLELINTGVEQLEFIGDAEKKATICADLAKAIAMSGLLGNSVPLQTANGLDTIEVEEPAEMAEPKKKSKAKSKTKKDALKTGASKETETEAETVEPEVIEEETPELPEVQELPEDQDIWTDEAEQQKAESLERLNQFVEAWGEEYVAVTCLEAFTENLLSGMENITPSMIDGFVAYLDAISQEC